MELWHVVTVSVWPCTCPGLAYSVFARRICTMPALHSLLSTPGLSSYQMSVLLRDIVPGWRKHWWTELRSGETLAEKPESATNRHNNNTQQHPPRPSRQQPQRTQQCTQDPAMCPKTIAPGRGSLLHNSTTFLCLHRLTKSLRSPFHQNGSASCRIAATA